MKINYENFINDLKLEEWFNGIFRPKNEKNFYSLLNFQYENNFLLAENLEEAVKIWNNNFEFRCEHWELLRVRLLKNSEWLSNFHFVRNSIFFKFNENNKFNKLIKILSENFNIEKDAFISELPVIGAWGEHLLNQNSNYYSKQIPFYQSGFWLCGYKDENIVLF